MLADKGFSFQFDLALKGGKLIVPPGRSGRSQFPEEDVRASERISKFRIHVEQAFGRLEQFRILKNEIRDQSLHNRDDIVTCCIGICNLYKPVAY